MNSSLQLIWLLGDDEVQALAQQPKQGISGSASIRLLPAVRPVRLLAIDPLRVADNQIALVSDFD
jgi:hypothetical protein